MAESFDWNEYYNAASQILMDVPDSNLKPIHYAKIRICVSRFYYAAFHCCKNYLEENDGRKIPENQAHQTIDGFIRGKNIDDLSNAFRDLREARNKADYDNKFPFAKQTAIDAQRDFESVSYEIKELIRKSK